MNEKILEMTNTVGFFNGNKWPIQLVISSLSVTLHLQPGEYIKDRKGRKINDPFFDGYAKNRQLSREMASEPVPLIKVPPPDVKAQPHDGQSVRQITEFTHTAAGVRVPVMPQPKAVPQQTINQNSVQAMTIDEARRRGLAHRTREVPEDYGLTDNDSAMPPRLPPPIKIATDLKPTKHTSLPQELLAEEIPAGRSALVQSLTQQAATPAPEDAEPTGFLNTVTQNAPPNSPLVAGPAAPGAVKPRPRPPLPPLQEEEEPALPEPELEEPPVEEEAGQEAPMRAKAPAPPLPPVPSAPRPVTSRNKYTCMDCGLGFSFRSQLARHAVTKHKEIADAIMAAYPEGQ